MSYRKSFDLSVYFVADPSLCAGRNVEDIVRAAAEGGATMIQYRDKTGSKDDIFRTAHTLKEILSDYNIPLIINDYADLAKELDADGVHLGQDDAPPEEAREILGHGAIIGQTAFTEEQIKALDPAIVDYIGTGPFYATKTDKGKPVLGADRFSLLKQIAPVPVAGIGGITVENAEAVIKVGADGVAMMRAVSEADQPEETVQRFLSVVKSARMKEAS